MKLFDPKDYQSISVKVTVKNLTSGLDLTEPPSQKVFSSGTSQIQLLEFQEKGVAIFGFPKNSCASGHNLALTMTVKDYLVQFTMSLTAKVLAVESDQDDFARITIQFVQYVQEDWEKFLDIYSKRQQEILEFFAAVKGEA